nr:hypothetical protein [Acinetobacter ursingii]
MAAEDGELIWGVGETIKSQLLLGRNVEQFLRKHHPKVISSTYTPQLYISNAH